MAGLGVWITASDLRLRTRRARGYHAGVATGNASIELKGAIITRPASANACGNSTTSGPVFQLALAAANRSAASLSSATVQVIASPAAYEALPIAANQRSTFVYLRGLDIGPWAIRLTFETTAQAVIPLSSNGSFLMEFPADDRVTLVELQGSGRVEWIAAGGIV